MDAAQEGCVARQSYRPGTLQPEHILGHPEELPEDVTLEVRERHLETLPVAGVHHETAFPRWGGGSASIRVKNRGGAPSSEGDTLPSSDCGSHPLPRHLSEPPGADHCSACGIYFSGQSTVGSGN